MGNVNRQVFPHMRLTCWHRRTLRLAAMASGLSALGMGCHALGWKSGSGGNIRPGSASRTIARSAPVADSDIFVVTQLVDQPAGSAYLNQGLWGEVSDPLPHELSTLFAANGLRIGLATGKPPAELERLGTSEASSIGLTQRSFTAGESRTIPVNAGVDSSRLKVVRELRSEAEEWSRVATDCGLDVVVRPTADGRVTLRATIQLQHGERLPVLAASADGTGFTKVDQRPLDVFQELTFEVTLGRRDVLVVGATEEPAGTLGQSFFLTANAERPRQRLLVVQAGSAVESSKSKSDDVAGGRGSGSHAAAAQAWALGDRRPETPRR